MRSIFDLSRVIQFMTDHPAMERLPADFEGSTAIEGEL
jgi:hypothetical protein